MAIEHCSIILMFGLMLSTLKRKEKRASRMFKLLCSVSYYTRLGHSIDVERVETDIDIDIYMKLSYSS
jgi:hypothetical protein